MKGESFMKIGIQTSTFDTDGYGRWKDKTYKKLKEHGYACTDFAKALKDINFEGCLSLETMPPRRLEDNIFEDMCHTMFTLAEKISEKTGL